MFDKKSFHKVLVKSLKNTSRCSLLLKLLAQEHRNTYFSVIYNAISRRLISGNSLTELLSVAALKAIFNYYFLYNMKGIFNSRTSNVGIIIIWKLKYSSLKEKSIDRFPYDWHTKFQRVPSHVLCEFISIRFATFFCKRASEFLNQIK